MRIAALGRTGWLYDSIVALRKAGHDIVLIATAPAATEYGIGERDFELLAHEIGCRYIGTGPLNAAHLRELGAEAAVSVNWPTLLPAEVLGSFRHGVINAHAGDLPRYRGNACPNWAILTGEPRVVLTLHRMSEALDAGPVLLKKPFALDERTYIGDVYEFLAKAIPQAFVEAIDGLARGTLKPAPQDPDPSKSLRCFPRRPEDSELAWARPASDLARVVRASAEPFAGAYTHLEGRKLVVWRARAAELPYAWLGVPGQVAAIDAATGEVTVLAGRGVLVIEEAAVGERRGKPATLIRSTRARLGAV
jgi:UDP-4-amino-4-deoxy-L-arabinose formyltransferase/UDP-glucuronic acid dehydrogenase (UDP-4-keto-hexauronic acid decarboxylating)